MEPVTASEAARRLGIDGAVVTGWVKKSWVTVLQASPGPRQAMQLDWDSVLQCFARRAKADKRMKARYKAWRESQGASAPRRGRGRPRKGVPPAWAPQTPTIAVTAIQNGEDALITVEGGTEATAPTAPPHRPHRPSELKSLSLSGEREHSWPTLQLAEEYLREKKTRGASPSTLDTDWAVLSQFNQTVPIVHSYPSSCRRGDLTKYLESIPEPEIGQVGAKRGRYRPITRQRRWGRVVAFLHWLEHDSDYRIPAPSVRGLNPFAMPEKPDPLTLEELQRLLSLPQLLANEQEHALLLAFAATGGRTGGMCGLRRSDVHEGYIETREKTRMHVGILQHPITPDIRDLLLKVSEGREYVFAVYRTTKRKRRGDPMDRSGIYQRVRKYMDLAGIKRKHLGGHALRHTFGVLMLKATGGNIRLVQQLMGHKRITTTEIYTSFTDTSLQMEYAKANPMTLLQGLRPLAGAPLPGFEELVETNPAVTPAPNGRATPVISPVAETNPAVTPVKVVA